MLILVIQLEVTAATGFPICEGTEKIIYNLFIKILMRTPTYWANVSYMYSCVHHEDYRVVQKTDTLCLYALISSTIDQFFQTYFTV